MLAGAAGPAPGASTANWWVPLSKTAAAARAASGRNAPAGCCAAGGDTAACAGSIVRGGVSSGFDEHPVSPTSKTVTLNKTP
jgi:hypothetical protein